MARALEDGLVPEDATVFDFGCGRGGDVGRLKTLGFDILGFDPNFAPEVPLRRSRVVNLGYVVNVIEDEHERATVLRDAWGLAEELLVVSARLQGEEKRLTRMDPHTDGVRTGMGTFQKFFAQSELREWVDETLGVRSIAAEPGVFYVFRESAQAEAYLLTRVRRVRPRRRKSDVVFEENQELLEDFMAFVEERGRLPRRGEFGRATELRDAIGTPRQAFRIVKALTGEERWDRARVARYEDLLVYLALSRFGRRPRLSDLPLDLQFDIKDFFGSYKASCGAADRALFAIGDQSLIAEAIRSAKVGKRMPLALYVHTSAIADLPTSLRVLDGCARQLLGTPPDATIAKFDLERPRVSYLQYPSFDEEAHPALRGAFVVGLDSLRADFLDYSDRDNPPVLHRKELFVAPWYQRRSSFARLTRLEEKAGLYRSPERIGTARGWSQVLAEAGYSVRGHRLLRK